MGTGGETPSEQFEAARQDSLQFYLEQGYRLAGEGDEEVIGSGRFVSAVLSYDAVDIDFRETIGDQYESVVFHGAVTNPKGENGGFVGFLGVDVFDRESIQEAMQFVSGQGNVFTVMDVLVKE
ncbi:hypothetical protein GF389_03760 [Candidatus Dojkabacteria bacterium]|nr:hypothetical protein [Candidatus Dojkabacteria bacterium]